MIPYTGKATRLLKVLLSNKLYLHSMNVLRMRFFWYFLLFLCLAVTGYFAFRYFGHPEHMESGIVSKSSKVFANKADFGRALFFDKRLSLDNSISCASCHIPEKAFTDGQKKSIGVNGRIALRNAGTLLNVKDAPVFMFDAHISSLEQQAIVPIQDSNEMAIPMGDLIERLKSIDNYSQASKELYARELDVWVLTRALAAFQRTLISNDSPFDQYINGDIDAISQSAQKGWKLFNDFQCIECHSYPNFTNYQARNNGLYKNYGDDPGKFRIAGDSNLIGAFKVPSLRNITLTGPYMHDGSIQTLESVLAHYKKGGEGHALQDERVKKRKMTKEEERYLIEFFETLTDTSYMRKF